MDSPASEWILTVLGTGNLNSQTFRGQAAVLLEARGSCCLFDCGDGTADRLRKLGKTAIEVIAVSEVSSTAMGGILAVAELNHYHGRPPVTVVGPPGITDALSALVSISRSPMEELFIPNERTSGLAFEYRSGVFLESVPMDVGESSIANAYLIYESAIPGKIDAQLGAKLGLRGSDYTQIQAGHSVRGVRPADIVGPPQLGRRIVIGARGRQTDSLLEALEGSDVAILAAPFTDERLQVAVDSHFLTGWEAAKLFSETRVKFALITQLGPSSPGWIQLAEARQYLPSLNSPSDGQSVEIPLPSRGVSSFVRAPKQK